MNLKQINIQYLKSHHPINKFLLSFKIVGFEAAIWVGALLFLAFVHNPGSSHFTICPIKNLGFDFCPGCGLGNSVSYIFHGDIYNSFLSHPLGLLALIVLFIRIIQLIKNNWSNYGKYFTTNALS
jgi:Protein of unknown function (DUF2752)